MQQFEVQTVQRIFEHRSMVAFHLFILAEKIVYNHGHHVEPIAVTPQSSTCLVWLRFNSSRLMDGSRTLASRFFISLTFIHIPSGRGEERLRWTLNSLRRKCTVSSARKAGTRRIANALKRRATWRFR